jgi:beta-lactamase superfamily II metal-dependent hydrolase
MLEILVFNVGAGQCIFFYPNGQPEYTMLVDCHESDSFIPIDFLLARNLLHYNGARHVLSNLTVTNYDHDHFSGLPKIMERVHIDTVRLPKNISSEELKEIKEESTDALEKILEIFFYFW